MAKILGLDLGTNSIGWAIVENEEGNFKMIDKGVRIFQEGVKIEKGIEGSKAAERTGYRSARRIKYRRKLRKIQLLEVLTEFEYCPVLTKEDLDNWRYKKIYPKNEAFIEWWKTDDLKNKTPYFYRNLAVTEKLDLNVEEDRFKIGRALYHMAQRRGFLSNRLEGTKESEGAVKKEIAKINEEKGNLTLGQYFYEKYLKGEKIRDTYTSRETHYLDEFMRISDFQNLPDEFIKKAKDAIFYQRPLKSQKGLIGKCVFEKNKPRCQVSRIEFEEYRMLSFLNNIKIKTPEDEKLRFLSEEEKEKAKSQFFRKSKEHFDFEDIAKQLAPKKQYKFYKDSNKNPEDYLFNYSMKTSVSGCPVTSKLIELFGDNIYAFKILHNNQNGNLITIDIDDVWHVLNTFDSEDKLIEFGRAKLKLNNEEVDKFCKIKLKQEYTALSLKAIKKILPYLRKGLIYSHAVFLANMEVVLPAEIWNNEENQLIINNAIFEIIQNHTEENKISEVVNGIIKDYRDQNVSWSKHAEEYFITDIQKKLKRVYGENYYNDLPETKKNSLEKKGWQLLKEQMQKNMGKGEFINISTIKERIITFLFDNFEIDKDKASKLYHPSAIETYKPAEKAKDGKYYLGSPMVSSVKNPMAMRALHQLRKVINQLISEGVIDRHTKINIEMARDLKNANERKGLQDWQREREKTKSNYAEKIKAHFKQNGKNLEPSADDILKYQLWEEQHHKCVYTGDEIAISDFLGADPKYDIEHTIPRSISFDNSQENKTLCQNRYNRAIKKNKIPYELQNHDEILDRIKHWKKDYEKIKLQIEGTIKQAKSAGDKNQKDKAIQRRHRLTYEMNYLRNKYSRFLMKDVPEGFKNSQIVDTGIITKYSRLYLKSVFSKVYTVKGNTVADFRRMWGIQDEYDRKERVNHVHHCIDAATIACITKENYEHLAKYYHDRETSFIKGIKDKPKVPKPWKTFTEDVKNIENEILISHHTPDVLPKQTKKKLRKRGVIEKKPDGSPIIMQGDTARGSLHKETFYGAIEVKQEDKNGKTNKAIKYVVRKPLAELEQSAIKNIVDERVRNIVENGRKKEKLLRKEIENLQTQLKNAEEADEKAINEDIDKLKNQIDDLYCLPNKNGAPIPIRKVRIFQPTVTNPIFLKEHRDKSTTENKPWKEHIHVANDGNYCMAIYEGKDKNGKVKRDFQLANNIGAAEFFKLSVQKDLQSQNLNKIDKLFPEIKLNGKIELPLRGILKIGTMVILWENNPEEVWDLDIKSIKRRLYKVIGLSNQKIKGEKGQIWEFATIVLRFHQEATSAKELKTQDGVFKNDEEYKPQRKLNHNQFNALIEDIDFKISLTGKLIQLSK